MPRLRSHSAVNIQLPQLRSCTQSTVISSKKSVVPKSGPRDQSIPKPSQSTKSEQATNKSTQAIHRKNSKVISSRCSARKSENKVPFAVKHDPIPLLCGNSKSDAVVPIRVKRKREKKIEGLDPYSLEALIDDDEKENIDPSSKQRPIVAHKKATTTIKVSDKPRVSFIFSPSTLSARPIQSRRLSIDMERRQSAAATIRLPLPPHPPPTPHSTDLTNNRLASTPAVPALSHVPRLSKNFTPIHSDSDPGTSGVKKPSSPKLAGAVVLSDLVPAVHVENVELFVENAQLASPNTSSHQSSSSQPKHRSRSQSLSDRDEAYTSWLEEFNAKLEQFASHELTVEEDKSN